MPFLKTVTFLLIAAIGNPYCCCLADTSSEEEAVQHACCELTQGLGHAKDDAASHNPDDCQHQVEKEAQISQVSESGDAVAKPTVSNAIMSVSFSERIVSSCGSKYQTARSIELVSQAKPPIAQAYCIFLI